VSGQASCASNPSSQHPGTYPGAITCAPGSLSATNYTFAAGASGTLTTTRAQQSISFPATAVTEGQADFSPATANSGLTVTYSDPSGQCTIDGQGLVHVTDAGACTVTANQAGNQDYEAAIPVTGTFSISGASSPPPSDTPTTPTTPTTPDNPDPTPPTATTPIGSAGRAKVSGTSASDTLSCTGTAGTCIMTVRLTVTGTPAGKRAKPRKKTVTVATKTVTLGAGKHAKVTLALNATGKRLLAKHHTLPVQLTVTQGAKVRHSQKLTFKKKQKAKHR
jgi:hypothetical protein